MVILTREKHFFRRVSVGKKNIFDSERQEVSDVHSE